MGCLAMSDEYRIVYLDRLTLVFEPIVGVDMVNYPGVIVGTFGCKTGLLFPCNWRVSVRLQWLATQLKNLFNKVRVCLDVNFLAIPKHTIILKQILITCLIYDKDGPCDGTRVVSRCRADIVFIKALCFVTDINNYISFSFFIHNHH